MDAIASWPAFGITADIKTKLLAISPAAIDRALKKDKAAHRIPIRDTATMKNPKLDPQNLEEFNH
jgi:hypothetical protein